MILSYIVLKLTSNFPKNVQFLTETILISSRAANPDSMPNWAPHGFSLGWAGLKWAGFGEWAQTGPHVG